MSVGLTRVNYGLEGWITGRPVHEQWDKDDTMLLWGNTQAADERYRKKQKESTHYTYGTLETGFALNFNLSVCLVITTTFGFG